MLSNEVRRWLLLPVAMLMALCALSLGRLAYGLLLPAMKENLGLTLQQAGNLGTAISLGYLFLVLPAGLMVARVGARCSVMIGLTLLAAGFALLGLSSSYPVMLLIMMLLGLGTALSYTPLVSLLVGWYPNRRSTVLGIANSGIGIGIFASGFYVPWLINTMGTTGWRSAWFSFAALTVIVLVLAFLVIRNPPGSVGSVTAARTSQVSAVAVFKNRAIQLIGLIYALQGFTYIIQSLFMYSYALDMGLSARLAGSLSAMGGFISILAGPVWGVISDRIGRASTLLICFTCNAIATLIPVLMPTEAGFALHFGLSGLVVTGLFTTILAATSEKAAPAEVSIAVGFVTLLFATGQLLGPALAALIAEYSGTFKWGFCLSGALMFFAATQAYRLLLSERRRPA